MLPLGTCNIEFHRSALATGIDVLCLLIFIQKHRIRYEAVGIGSGGHHRMDWP